MICHQQIRKTFCNLFHPLPVRGHCSHAPQIRTLRRLMDILPTCCRDIDQILKTQHSGGIEGHVLTIAMSGGHVRLQTKTLQQMPESRLHNT